MDKDGRDLFFQVISKRAETGSMIITTNKAFKDWTEVFQDNAVATAIAERLIEHGELIKIEGPSYRMKKRKQRQQGLENFRAGATDGTRFFCFTCWWSGGVRPKWLKPVKMYT